MRSKRVSCKKASSVAINPKVFAAKRCASNAAQQTEGDSIVTASVTEAVAEGNESPARNSPRGTRKARPGQGNGAEGQRFFIAKHGGTSSVPELGRELRGEAEAMVESLKTGLSYFMVSEWRGVADFSGRKPQLSRDAVRAAPKTG